MPSAGTIATSRGSYWGPCWERAVYDVRSGLVVAHTTCEFNRFAQEPGAGLHHRDRWQLARIDPLLLQELALLLAVAKHFAQSPSYAESFELPHWAPHAPPYWIRVRRVRPMVSDALEIRYNAHGVLDEILSDTLYVERERAEDRRLLVNLFETIRNARETVCLHEDDRATVARISRRFFAVHAAASPETALESLRRVPCPG
jgi:hypothetical protein